MKEYTALAVISVFAVLALDAGSGVRILRRKDYYFFLAAILVFKLLVNGYLTGAKIVLYNPEHFLGWRIGTIPLEDFFFAFSMVSVTMITWEYFKKK
jgi:lycopene cyclase domain-containing protein